MVYWTSWTIWCQTNDRGHSGYGEAWGGAILLLHQGRLILRWWLWTHCHYKMLCCMGQIEWAPVHPHLPLISHHLQMKRSQFMHQEHQAHSIESWAQPYLTFTACNATTEVWSAECTVSPPRTKSAHKISWRGCSLMIRQKYSTDSDVTAM